MFTLNTKIDQISPENKKRDWSPLPSSTEKQVQRMSPQTVFSCIPEFTKLVILHSSQHEQQCISLTRILRCLSWMLLAPSHQDYYLAQNLYLWVPSETHLVSGSLSRWQCYCTWVKLKASSFHSLLVTRKLTQFLCSSSLVVCPKPLPTQVWNGIK